MQTQSQEKPRLTYRDFVAQQAQPLTVARIIERYIVEMNGLDGRPPVKTIGVSQYHTLRLLQRYPVGSIAAAVLTKADVITHCRQRQSEGVKPQTVMQDVTYLSGTLKYAGSAWEDCGKLSDAAMKAKPFLLKHNLISKSTPREARPSLEMLESLLAHFAEENKRPRNVIDMVAVMLWQLRSARRISETCRLQWADWDRESHTILVHKMKDPRNRNKTKKVALPKEAQAMLEEMWELRNPEEPRIFPYVAKSCVARYVVAKHALGIGGAHHLHDLRAECATRLIEKGYSTTQVIMVSGHETDHMLQRTYMRQRAESFKDGPVAARA